MITKAEKAHWDRVAEFGCIACRIDGYRNNIVSIHHCDGRTKKGAHMKVIALCAGHHQDGTGNDKNMLAIHPFKRRFEAKYGTQQKLIEITNKLIERSIL
jgi:Recombination enhancement, RecA-dependent nuclease